MDTAADALAIARALLDPTGQGLFPDAALMPYLNAAYRAIGDEVVTIREWTANEAVAALPALPAYTTTLAAFQAPGQPLAALEQPIAIREKPAGAPPEDYQEVRLVDELPARSPAAFLLEYEWRGAGVVFIGASQVLDLEVRFVARWGALSAPADPLAVNGLANTLGWWTAGLMCSALREDLKSQQYLASARHFLFQRINDYVKTSQMTLRRPRPYRSGWLWNGAEKWL